MKSALQDYAIQRATFRLPMLASDPVHLLFSVDGENVDPLADELGAGGARFVATKGYDKLYQGQMLGPAVLLLPDIGMPVVYPVVRWMSYPRIGVQFADMSEKNKEMIGSSAEFVGKTVFHRRLRRPPQNLWVKPSSIAA